MSAALDRLGWGPRWAALAADHGSDGAPVRVVRRDRGHVLVTDGTDERQLPAEPGGVEPDPVTGDWALVVGDELVAVLPRATELTRRAAGEATAAQVMAANVDLVVIVHGLDRELKSGRLERSLVLAWDSGAMPLVVLSKADLVADASATAAQAATLGPGVDVLVTSAETGEGSDELLAAVADRSVVLIGESGAGKSRLANLLLGEDRQAVGEVRAGDAKGRHTTTTRELMQLPAGGVLIDTPGIRSVGMWLDDYEGLDAAFAEIGEAAAGCRFNDCRHDTEPGCAVRAAVEDGSISPDRLASYVALRNEAEGAAARADVVGRRKEGKRFGRMAREAQRLSPKTDRDR